MTISSYLFPPFLKIAKEKFRTSHALPLFFPGMPIFWSVVILPFCLLEFFSLDPYSPGRTNPPMAESSASTSETRIETLILDAGPLVTQSPLRGLAKQYYIPPSVVAELKDKRAKDHLDWLRSEGGGCNVEIREPGPEAMVAVIAFAKQTGDYSVLSRPDLSVLALTYAIEVQKHGMWRIRDQVGGKTGQQKNTIAQQAARNEDKSSSNGEKKKTKPKTERISDVDHTTAGSSVVDEGVAAEATASSSRAASQSLQENDLHDLNEEARKLSLKRDPNLEAMLNNIPLKHVEAEEEDVAVSDDEDDEETGGEWITPENITKHKNRALGLVTDEDLPLSSAPAPKSYGQQRTQIVEAEDGWSTVVTKKAGPSGEARQEASSRKAQASNQGKMTVACMTGDYAVQNVLLQMGLSLVGIQGQKIKQVKSWVLRCHACFKICKDSEKKFCPQCGNPTLLRTSVTSTAPDSSSKGGGLQVHLKKNFQYKNRGSIYSLPLPKQGRAGGAAKAVPILREDQAEWQKAVKMESIKRNKEERALQKALERGTDSLSARYEEADELSALLAGGNVKNRTTSTGLPSMGIGRKNPNERRRRKV
jgi:RNA-binding protein NOB1